MKLTTRSMRWHEFTTPRFLLSLCLVCMGGGWWVSAARADGVSGALNAELDQKGAILAVGQRSLGPPCAIRRPPMGRLACPVLLEAGHSYTFVGASIGAVKDIAIIAFGPNGDRLFKESPGASWLRHLYTAPISGLYKIDLIIDSGDGEAGLRVYGVAPPSSVSHTKKPSRSKQAHSDKQAKAIPKAKTETNEKTSSSPPSKDQALVWEVFPKRG